MRRHLCCAVVCGLPVARTSRACRTARRRWATAAGSAAGAAVTTGRTGSTLGSASARAASARARARATATATATATTGISTLAPNAAAFGVSRRAEAGPPLSPSDTGTSSAEQLRARLRPCRALDEHGPPVARDLGLCGARACETPRVARSGGAGAFASLAGSASITLAALPPTHVRSIGLAEGASQL